MAEDPQATVDRRIAARHLLQHPLTCAEHDRDVFRLIRRHEVDLDRWFTQRLGYRLHVDADTARLQKSTVLPWRRPLRTSTGRPLTTLEHTLLALVLASVAAGPAVVSLRDLVDEVRSAAVEADITLVGDVSERRALVVALKWMIERGLAAELHEHVDAYATDDDADAVLKIRPDRVALVALPTLVGAESTEELLERAERRAGTRAWLRAKLVEDPVVYRDDLDEETWRELRRRLAEDRAALEEMFGLLVEARAEGVAAIDPTGSLSDLRFPTGGTVGHAALLLLDALSRRDVPPGAPTSDDATVGLPAESSAPWHPIGQVHQAMAGLAAQHAARWSAEMVEHPERLAARVLELLTALRLVEHDGGRGSERVRVLAASARFVAEDRTSPEAEEPAVESAEQAGLW